MAAAVHSNVGLMHATMAIFNAWCDRMPMVVLGATGPVDAVKRRPWIDWIHTARDQGALIRGYTKWDDQPASPARRARSDPARRLDRQHRAARADLRQSRRRHAGRETRRAGRADRRQRASCRRSQSAAPPEMIAQAAELLRAAKHPVILAGRVSRDVEALERARRARRTARRPRRHRSEDRRRLPDRSSAACRRARRHRAGARSRRRYPRRRCHPQPRLARSRRHVQACRRQRNAKVIQVSVDHHLHNGWSMDYQGLPPVDVLIACEPDAAVPPLLDALGRGKPHAVADKAAESIPKPAGDKLTVDHLADALARARSATGRSRSPTYRCRGTAQLAVPPSARLSRRRRRRRRRRRTRHFGRRGAGAERHRPAAGRGLRRRRFPDGRHRALDRGALPIPLLLVVANNRSFFNDELHQERVARMRNRPVENRWVGQRISEPDIDLAGHGARARRAGFRPGDRDRRSRRRLCRKRSPRSRPAQSPSSMCASSRATPPR